MALTILFSWIVQSLNTSNFYRNAYDFLRKGGVLMVDDVFQAGTILDPIEDIPRGQRAIHRKLNLFLNTVMDHPQLTSSLIPLGDGVILITKEADHVDVATTSE